MKFNIEVTSGERAMIVTALMAYGAGELAFKIHKITRDIADDGPEVEILQQSNVPSSV